MLASSPAGTAQLDLVCAYLKRVYFYLYYRGQQCRDEGDMIATRGAGRGVPAASKEEVEAASDLHALNVDAVSLDVACLLVCRAFGIYNQRRPPFGHTLQTWRTEQRGVKT